MSNPRELADKAIALLQDALRDSEARVAELNETYTGRIAELHDALASLRAHDGAPDAEHAPAEPAHAEPWNAEAAAAPPTVPAAEIDDLQQRLADANAALDERNVRITALAEQLGHARDAGPTDAAARPADEDNALQVLRDDLEAACKSIDERDKRIAALLAQLDAPRREETPAVDEAAVTQLRDDLEAAGKTIDERDRRIASMTDELETLRAVPPAGNGAETLQAQLDGARGALADREARLAEAEERARTLTSELNDAHEANVARLKDLDALRDELHELRGKYELGKGESEELGRNRNRLAAELNEAIARAETAEATCQSLSEKIDNLESGSSSKAAELDELQRQHAQLEADISAARERIGSLEATLKEEKEFSENLSEVANERRERINKLEEDLEVTEERFEEAKWQLGKAEHYKRLVQRRRKLIDSLIADIRAKAKANRALKAGLDGLRTFKAAAEMNQQKLLSRIEDLKYELGETAEQLAQAKLAATAGSEREEQTRHEHERQVEALNGRLTMQTEIIGSLEDELKIAKGDKRSRDHMERELETLRDTLKLKNDAISRLQTEIDEQQRKLGQLRGSESETTRLRALSEQDKGQITALEDEISSLREQLSSRAGASGDGAKNQEVARLKQTIRERDETIAALEESVEAWKKKYKFVSAEPPPAYQTANAND